jgi:indole-3-glycerol phosphate synthase
MSPSLQTGDPNRNRSKVTRTLPETQGHDALPGILAEIVRSKRSELQGLRKRAHEIEGALPAAPPVRDFKAALASGSTVALIAECKRRSPGAGAILTGLEPTELTRGYEAAGAAALSVLTDGPFFGGSVEDLALVRAGTSIPILRKDFVLDTLHVLEARACGADAVLLIARILDDATLARLHAEAMGLGMGVLVEVHDAGELERAVRIGAVVVGINNRDLATFTTDLETSLRLLAGLPDHVLVVSESGIRTREDVERLGDAGVDAILVGESLLRADDPAAAARALTGVPRRGSRG